MAALTKDRNTPSRGAGRVIPIPVAASTEIFAGGGVCVNAAGFAVPASDTSGLIPMGLCKKGVDNSSGSNGDKTVLVYQVGTFEMVASGMAQSNVGDVVYWSDDQTVAASTTNSIKAGQIVAFTSATKVEVAIDDATLAA